MTLEPIVYVHALACPAERAFALYTLEIGDWWPAAFTASGEALASVRFADGRLFETNVEGRTFDWGAVTVWAPPSRLEHTWVLAQDRDHPTRVAVRFTDDDTGGGCEFRFEHGGWTAGNADARPRFADPAGWPLVLSRFMDRASAG